MIDTSRYPDCVALDQRYRILLQEIELEGRSLFRHIRADKSTKNKLSICLLSDAEEHLARIAELDRQLTELEKDALEFSTMLGDFPNIRAMGDVLNRERNKIERAVRDARLTYESALRNHRELTPEDVQQLDVMCRSAKKADHVTKENAPKVADLEERLDKCKAILAKYREVNQ